MGLEFSVTGSDPGSGFEDQKERVFQLPSKAPFMSSQYAIITPAKNEEPYIERTIESVISQTHKPSRWIIVDDGSTDHTAAIVSKYLASHDFIRLVKMREGDRNFASKVHAFNAGLELLKGAEYPFIANLDADISLAPDYYANIIAEFEMDPRLGVAGGQVYTISDGKLVSEDAAPDSIGGAVQVFRRECFDQVGGYLPLELGGEDATAEIIARMKGWSVRKFSANQVCEHRRAGLTKDKALAMYRLGMRFHSLGYSAVYYILRSLYRLSDNPPVIGSAFALLGFFCARFRRRPVQMPQEAVSYLRSEQMGKLRAGIFGKFGLASRNMDSSL
jgi:glycosyltransferase involved in cell wall biosynthesis